MRSMFRFLRNLLLLVLFAGATAGSYLVFTSSDPFYTVHEWIALGRFSAFDQIIREQSTRHGVDPALVKAMIWRESAFHPEKVGTSGERGLMQVGEAAAQDWAKAEKIEGFTPTDLYDAQTNITVGTWYLRRALERWKGKDDPVPFALAEYNAGASRVDRWVAATGHAERTDAHDLMNAIDFPTTRRYVQDITERRRAYTERGGQ